MGEESSTTQQFLELVVEDFDSDGNDSFLRIGTSIGEELAQDSNDLAGNVTTFIDDTRDRDGDDAEDTAVDDDESQREPYYTLTETQRGDDTALLQDKGGWRDHTDGNRITTTRGDKVEVIYGNYKLMVLGRKQWTNGAGVGLHQESSGGITYHYDEVPGQVVDIRWEKETQPDTTKDSETVASYDKDDQAAWLKKAYDQVVVNTPTKQVDRWHCIEECDTGHFVERFEGVEKEWIQGGDVVTRIGTLEAYDGTTSDTDPDNFIPDPHFDKPEDASHNAEDPDDPDSYVWPSGTDHLPDVRDEVWANNVFEKVIADAVYDIDGSSSRPMTKLDELTHTGYLEDIKYYDDYRGIFKGGTAEEYWYGPLYMEMFGGANTTYKKGTFIDVRFGVFIAEINLVSIVELNAASLRTDFEATGWKSDVVISAAPIVEMNAAALHVKCETHTKTKAHVVADRMNGINFM